MSRALNKYVFVYVLLVIAQLSITQVVKAQQLPLQTQPFTQSSFEAIKEQFKGEKWLTMLWSVDCPPCMKELALIQTLQLQQKELTVVIINVDTYEGSEQQRDEILAHFDLTQRKHFYFIEGLEDQSRYHIDPQWFGELPRSYFIDEAGTFHGKSGLVSKVLLEKWLLTASR